MRMKHDFNVRRAAKESLVRPAVVLSGIQARAVARGVAKYVESSNVIVNACAILQDHVHLLVSRHRLDIETLASKFKAAATSSLSAEGLHPFAEQSYKNGKLPSPWAKKHWSVFLGTDQDIGRTVKYINDNPIRHGMKPQRYRFVTLPRA